MSIDRFYNIYAILERYTLATDDYGQEIKTWTVSTTIFGCKQNRSGNKSIVNNVEKNRTNDRFYCDSMTISTATDRLLFSTNTYSFKGNASDTSALTGNSYGDLYFCNGDFSTYVYGDYIRYSSTGDYKIEEFNYFNILNIYNLLDRHMQIDLDEDNKNRI